MVWPLTGKRVAVIENDEQTLEALRTLLQSWGCAVAAATSTRELLKTLSHAPDLVIADYHLDSEIGTETIDRLRQQFGIRLPALVISSDHSAEPTVKALGHEFLGKPTPPARMRAMLSFLLDRANR